jgi:HemY protein
LLWLLLKLAGLLVALLRFINGDDTAISRYFEASRKRRGLEALTDGFVALASGEGDRAVSKGRKAEKLLENRTLSNLLIAQGAQSRATANWPRTIIGACWRKTARASSARRGFWASS